MATVGDGDVSERDSLRGPGSYVNHVADRTDDGRSTMNHCTHCDLPLGDTGGFERDGNPFCCQGCAIIHDTIDK